MMLDGNSDAVFVNDDADDATWIVLSLMLTSSPEDAPSDMAALVSPKTSQYGSLSWIKLLFNSFS